MGCFQQTPANRRYLRRMFVGVAIYLATVFLAVYSFHHLHPSRPVMLLLATLPSLAIVGIIAGAGLYLKEETDEFQRSLRIGGILWGTGFTLAITSVWGFLHSLLSLPALDLTYVATLFWLSSGISETLIRLRYRGASGE